MGRVEYLERHESKYHPSYEELLEESNAHQINKALAGQLSYTAEEWLKGRKKYDGH
jgi:hypothetical protein